MNKITKMSPCVANFYPSVFHVYNTSVSSGENVHDTSILKTDNP